MFHHDDGPSPVTENPGERRIPGAVLRNVRRRLGLSREEMRTLLHLSLAAYARYEQRDAPPWMRYALVGVGVTCCRVPVDEMLKRVGLQSLEDTDSPLRRGPLADAIPPTEDASDASAN